MSEKINLGMTSINTPSPYVVTSSSYLWGESAFSLLSNVIDAGTTWYSAQGLTQWVKINLGSKKCLQHIRITNRKNDPANIWAPQSIKISGSPDDITYTQLFNNPSSTIKTNGGINICYLANPYTAYQYYKCEFTSGSAYNYIALNCIELFEKIDYNLFLTESKYVSIIPALYSNITHQYSTVVSTGTVESVESMMFNVTKLFTDVTINGDGFVPYDKVKPLLYNDYKVLLNKKITIQEPSR